MPGNYLDKPDTTKLSDKGTSKRFIWGVSSMQSWRKTMEDTHIIETDLDDGISIFGVFDGHGGHEVAEFAAKYFTQILKSQGSYDKKDYGNALVECFIALDEKMLTPEGQEELNKLKNNGSLSPTEENKEEGDDAGCAACVVLVTQDKIICANSGDSRAVLSIEGKSRPLSSDHKPDKTDEKKRILEADDGFIERKRVNGVLALSRTLGDFRFKQDSQAPPEEQIVTCVPDILEEPLSSKDDFIIVACDGIWDCMTNQQAVDFINQRLNNDLEPVQAIEEMFDINVAKEKGLIGSDNMTCIVAKFKN